MSASLTSDLIIFKLLRGTFSLPPTSKECYVVSICMETVKTRRKKKEYPIIWIAIYYNGPITIPYLNLKTYHFFNVFFFLNYIKEFEKLTDCHQLVRSYAAWIDYKKMILFGKNKNKQIMNRKSWNPFKILEKMIPAIKKTISNDFKHLHMCYGKKYS